MKKLLAILLVLCCTFALFANGAPEAPKAEEPKAEPQFTPVEEDDSLPF